MNTDPFLRLPVEIIDRILFPILNTELETWIPSSSSAILLCYDHSVRLGLSQSRLCQPFQSRPRNIRNLALSCRALQQASQGLLITKYKFLITVNVTEEAPAGANSFMGLDTLHLPFRHKHCYYWDVSSKI